MWVLITLCVSVVCISDTLYLTGKNSPIWCIPCLDEAKALIEKLDSSIQNTTEFVAGL